MRYCVHPEAEAEFVQAIEYYEGCEVGLGYDFAVEVYSAIQRTMAYPKAWSLRKPQASSELERRFLDPFLARVFGNGPGLDYVAAVRAGQVPGGAA